jgi:hypothetical protein
MRRAPLALLLLVVVLTAGCIRGPEEPAKRPPLTGAAAEQEDRRLESELGRIPGVRSAKVLHVSETFQVGNSVSAEIGSGATSTKDADAVTEAALRILWNTRLFTPGVVNITVTGSTPAGGNDLRRLGFGSQGFALGSELRARFGTPGFESNP